MPYPQTYHDEYNTVFNQTTAYVTNETTAKKILEKFPAEVAVKFDSGKPDWAILPLAASEEIIKVFEFGAAKYARGNFLQGNGLSYIRVLNSTLRHVYSFMRGENLDPESGLSHLAHAGCNIYMLLTYELSKTPRTNDDRAEKVIQ
jgi:hypothetical protein